jgi:hypothetical protein
VISDTTAIHGLNTESLGTGGSALVFTNYAAIKPSALCQDWVLSIAASSEKVLRTNVTKLLKLPIGSYSASI